MLTLGILLIQNLRVYGLRGVEYANAETEEKGQGILLNVEVVTNKIAFLKLTVVHLHGVDCHRLSQSQGNLVYGIYKICRSSGVMLYDGEEAHVEGSLLNVIHAM